MKKYLCLCLLVFMFLGCETREKCTTCATIVKYPSQEVQIIETFVCGETIKDIDGRFSYAINPQTGEVIFYIISTCNE